MIRHQRYESTGFKNQADVLASIVVPCRGQLEYTERCLARLLRHTGSRAEFHFIDLGSLDGTREFLRGAATTSAVPLAVTLCAEDAEFPGALNEALAAARGEYIVWLSNETMVTPSWLEGLMAAARTTPGIGLLSPLTNVPATEDAEVPPFDVLEGRMAPRYPEKAAEDLAGLDEFAEIWRGQYGNRGCEPGEVTEACFLVSRPSVDALAPWGQWTHAARGENRLNHLDMNELSAAVRRLDLKSGRCPGVYVYSFGSRPAFRARPIT